MTEFLMTFLLNAFWQTALIVAAAMIATRLLRDAGSRIQHLIWVAALVLTLTLPLLTAAWLNAPDIPTPAETTTVAHVYFEEVGRLDFKPSPFEAPVTPIVPSAIAITTTLAFAILALYGLFVAYRAGVLVNARVRTTAIRRRCSAAKLPVQIQAAIIECRGLLTRQNFSVLISDEVSVPVTIGWLRPVIILPEKFLRETDANILTTAIGHEVVHIARRDYGQPVS
jgi:beta-lactamase regulating signal transducer with metallopeptidase domain